MISLNKYLAVFTISWSNGFIYRLNFIMWRVRMIVQTLTLFFLWQSIMTNSTSVLFYRPSQMFSYVLIASVLRSLVFASRSIDIQTEISNGDLNNYLTKPISYFKYWFSRDLSDKLLNLIFSIFEISIIIILLNPSFILPPTVFDLSLFIISSIMGMILYFFFSLTISCSVFWIPEGAGWPQRFLIFVIMEFLSGGLFPLNILPIPIYQLIAHLPTAYFIFFPIQLFLHQLNPSQILTAFIISFCWVIVLYLLSVNLFKLGLKKYQAFGK